MQRGKVKKTIMTSNIFFYRKLVPYLLSLLAILMILACGSGASVSSSKEPTIVPDEIQVVRARVEAADKSAYGNHYAENVYLEDDNLIISVESEDDNFPDGFELQEDVANWLELALVDCDKYFLGSGTEGCTIKSTAFYKHVKVQVMHPNGDTLVSVLYTVGKNDYFSGIDGTKINSTNVFELADEAYINDKYFKKK